MHAVSECPEFRNRFERRINTPFLVALNASKSPHEDVSSNCSIRLTWAKDAFSVRELVACHVPNIIREDHPIAQYFPSDLSFPIQSLNQYHFHRVLGHYHAIAM